MLRIFACHDLDLPRRDDVASLASPRVDDEIKNAAGLSKPESVLAVVLATVDRFDDLWIIENAVASAKSTLRDFQFSARFFSSQLNIMIPILFVYTIYAKFNGLRPRTCTALRQKG